MRLELDKSLLTIALALLIISIFRMTGHCSELPVAPSSTPGSRAIFWSTSFSAVGATVFDERTTVEGIWHSNGGCYEANGGAKYPSPASLYAKNLAMAGVAIGAGYLITRAPVFRGHPKLAALVGSTFPAIVAIKHARGGARWYTFKDGACLR